MSEQKKYKVKFKNLKSGKWQEGKIYDKDVDLCKDLDITKPTMKSIIKKNKGIYSKFIKISVE